MSTNPQTADFMAYRLQRRLDEQFRQAMYGTRTLPPADNEPLTIDKLKRVMAKMKAIEPPPDHVREIVVTPGAVLPADGPRFPISRHRSRRIHKKLERRHGPQFDYRPAAINLSGRLLIHPDLVGALPDAKAGPAGNPLFGVPVRFAA